MTISTTTRHGAARDALTSALIPLLKHRVVVCFLLGAIAAAAPMASPAEILTPADSMPNAPAPRSTGQAFRQMSIYPVSNEESKKDILDILGLIESGNDRRAVGDGGRSRGPYQMSRAAWSDVTRHRRAHRLPVYSWRDGAHDPARSRVYAATYLDLLRRRLTSALGHPPADVELYAAYNLGFEGFRRRGFSLSRCPRSTREAAEAFR